MQKVLGDQTKITALISILRCHHEIAQRHWGQVEQVKKEKGGSLAPGFFHIDGLRKPAFTSPVVLHILIALALADLAQT